MYIVIIIHSTGDIVGAELADGGQVVAGQLAPQQTAAINLPATLFGRINDRADVGVFFALYNNSVLFPVNGGQNRNASMRRDVGTDVVAATVGPGITFQNLEENVTIVLRLQIPADRVRIHCYFII